MEPVQKVVVPGYPARELRVVGLALCNALSRL
jgi:hypothetical protein